MGTVTIKDIAKRLNISPSQVSRALNGKTTVKNETVEKVKAMAKEMGYVPNYLAKSLVTNTSNIIGLLLQDINNAYTAEFALAIISEAYRCGYQTLLVNSGWDEALQNEQLEILKQSRIAGLLIRPATTDTSKIIDLNIPAVLLNIRTTDVCNCVDVNHESGTYIAVKHVIECGYKKIGFIGGLGSLYSYNQKLKGFFTAMEEHSLPIYEKWICSGKYTFDNGYEQFKKICQSGDIPDAVICGNDLIALGVMHCADEFGIKVPDELGVIGFDDIPMASLPQIQLSTVSQTQKKMGEFAVKLLIEQITADEENRKSNVKGIFEPILVKRNTTKAKGCNKE